MRHLTFLLLFACFGLVLPACAQQATAPKVAKAKAANRGKKASPPASVTAKTDAAPVLTFERTSCFGTCPAYMMKVYADGRVAYEGRRFAPVEGLKELRLPVAAVNDMLRMAQEVRFDQFAERYARGTTDLPSTVVAVRQPSGKFKTVAVEEGEPANVRDFFAYLATQFDALAELHPEK